MADITRDQVIDYLSNLSVMDIAQLTKALEDKWGVKAAAPVALAAAVQGAAAADAAEEEQTEFTVELTSCGDKKIQVIKTIRELTQMGLKEAKDFVESAPKVVREGVDKEEAESIKKKLEESGATVTVK
ncbi:MAG: 50S ribosomal protein L7/L12 [Pseudomonadota bacterium]